MPKRTHKPQFVRKTRKSAPKREMLTVDEIRPLITKVLRDRLPRVFWAPSGVQQAISAHTNKTVTPRDFEEALKQEVKTGNVGRGQDRIWLPEARKDQRK